MIGAKLRQAREAAKMTQSDVAIACGHCQKDISKWELDKAGMTLETLVSLCHALKITPNYLLGFDDD